MFSKGLVYVGYYQTLKSMTVLPGYRSYIASQGDFKQCFPLTKLPEIKK